MLRMNIINAVFEQSNQTIIFSCLIIDSFLLSVTSIGFLSISFLLLLLFSFKSNLRYDDDHDRLSIFACMRDQLK
jgi:hypothetical protein